MIDPNNTLDFDTLLKLRLVVARVGEMDMARWWNTNGQLGALGASALRRGFPRTHYFAQARSVFAVAANKTKETYDPPDSVTLWQLPVEVEESFETKWEQWIDDNADWVPFFQGLADMTPDLEAELLKRELIDGNHVDGLKRLRRSADLRAVQVPDTFKSTNDDVTNLALAFARGEPGQLAVPYQARSSL